MTELERVLDLLKERGVLRAEFHEGGALRSVEFAPAVSFDDAQHEAPETAPVTRPRAVGGLVPRGRLDAG